MYACEGIVQEWREKGKLQNCREATAQVDDECKCDVIDVTTKSNYRHAVREIPQSIKHSEERRGCKWRMKGHGRSAFQQKWKKRRVWSSARTSEDKLIFATIQQREMECVRGSNGYKISCIHESRGHLFSPYPGTTTRIWKKARNRERKEKGPMKIRPWPRRNRAGC
ncbi:uncharacterized protein LOC100748674 isoform X1 [Bombus impatiens]|uniref:Uncharacterized protein LOC100748674 isoform X1 n=1 Tax=Bombus impatiens TaxID=132113 RepID=A0A6P8L4Z9_BOMIM|nr:uncharacterized protein LOC100748674 isoform X1 [Bombus impatiens]XP_033176658.1 uncharacterized protein LOC100748674 isoform X1 [Bombus impatiens]